MPRIVRRIDHTATTTADAAGTGTIVFNGPPRGWIDITALTVYVTPANPIPTATVYAGSTAVSGSVLAVLRGGDRGTFRGTGDRLNAGQQITLQWTGAAVGAQCQAVLRGETVEP